MRLVAFSKGWMCAGGAVLLLLAPLRGETPPLPRVSGIQWDEQKRVQVQPHPGVDAYKIFTSPTLSEPFVEEKAGLFSGYDWIAPAGAGGEAAGFFQVQVTPVPGESLRRATVLNRLAYGPTPGELERVAAMGVDAYIREQLAPERIEETLAIDALPDPSGWRFVSVTGTGSSSALYVYLTLPGEGYIDDLELVEGTVPGAGVNLIRNGGFESPLSSADWMVGENHAGSEISTAVRRSGEASLRLVASSGGSTRASAIVQEIRPALSSSRTYTLSYWFHAAGTRPTSLTVRLSRDGIASSPDSLLGKLENGTSEIRDLQAWHVLRAVQSRRQLLEVLVQFVDNHFTTYYSKSADYMGGRVSTGSGRLATHFEYRELKKWRDVLLNPNGTFYDLLRISAESPAMIIYLDTVRSNSEAANENYARELMELFTMGVDNGYDQTDIEEMSRAWTGWRVDKLAPGSENDPLSSSVSSNVDVPGYWTFRFSRSRHNTGAKLVFAGKTIEERFGPPHAGRSYELRLPARSGAAGIQDGYDIIGHLADLPYTQEYLSVKLCQWFVHDRFRHGEYDYTDPNLSAEARLIRECMAAWEKTGPDGRKGNLRQVLRVVFDSEMFHAHAASRQKVKTPLEFLVGAVRALRVERPDGSYTAETDGMEIADVARALNMRLFYREDPDGWPEAGDEWINTSSLVERMRFVQGLLGSTQRSDPAGLFKLKHPEEEWRDAGAVADFFLDLLFPGEGRANLALDRAAAIAYLDSNDTGAPDSSPFAGLNPSGTAYDRRVRGMVAMLMSLPRYQEQ